MLLLAPATAEHLVRLRNFCDFPIHAGISGNPMPATGGVALPPNATVDLSVADGWSGRVWGRTGCVAGVAAGSLVCDTGDCWGREDCAGAGGATPASLAEITFDADGGNDFYDVSLVDGYNLPIAMWPRRDTFAPGTGYQCGRAGCVSDLNTACPPELAKYGPDGKTVIGCRSACDRFGTDEFCCRGAHNSPATCGPSAFSEMFKRACPNSYSYAYDDPTSTFVCRYVRCSSF
ncbi:unnamed protein product [Phaeothamnion confervicola]